MPCGLVYAFCIQRHKTETVHRRDAFGAYVTAYYRLPLRLNPNISLPLTANSSFLQAMQMLNFLEEEVPSPEDFPPPLLAPGLRELDEALRCNICKEVYSAPVTIGCGHCFCSLVLYISAISQPATAFSSACVNLSRVKQCIRQELPQRAKQECPLCRAPTNESHIRKNIKLEDAVKAWNLARYAAARTYSWTPPAHASLAAGRSSLSS